MTFLLTDLARGGAETTVVSLATWLARRCWEVGVVSMLAPKDYTDLLGASGIPIASLGMRRKVPDPRAVFGLARILRQWRTQVLHCHMVHANLLGRVTRMASPVPALISTAHSINEGGVWREFGYRLTDRLSDLTTHVSRAGGDRYLRVRAVSPARLLVIPNAVDLDRYRPDPAIRQALRDRLGLKQRFIWLAVGRLEPAKDYPSLVKAFAKVGDQHPTSVLLVAGEGSCRPQVERMVADLGVTGRIRLLGLRDDVPDLMRAADAYVMSSAWEGMPLVLLEASASGLPIVATDTGGNREVVRDGSSGFLVPPSDPDSLARKMLDLMGLGEPERWQMGQAGRARMESEHALDRIAALWENIYRELVAGNTQRRNS
ncbi:MAG TPA: glycosyltransferase [Bacillota bacterium]|nr:glycosyltransferase [Bacillota bacterium]